MIEEEGLGRVIISTPGYPYIYVAGLAVFATAILITSLVLPVPSEIRVPGRITPVGGTATVNAAAPGSIKRILVSVGDGVKRGQHLMMLGRSISIGDNNIDSETAVNANNVNGENVAITRSTVGRLRVHLQDQTEAMHSLDLQIAAENSRLRITTTKAALISENIARTTSLVDRGFISRVQFDNLRSRQLDLSDEQIQNQQRVLSLKKERMDIIDDIASTRSTIEIEQHKGNLSTIQSDQGRLDIARSGYYVDSPIDGRVLDVRAISGQSPPLGATLAVIGTNSPMGIEVYIPAKTIGRVRVGQRVTATVGDNDGGESRTITGQIIEMSGTSTDSQTLENPELDAKTSYFRAVIAVTAHSHAINSSRLALRIGSSVYADVHVGVESFFHWAFLK